MLDVLVDRAFDAEAPIGSTFALLVVQAGQVVVERYGTLPNGVAVGPETPLRSWSVAKSVLHAVVGLLVREGALRPEARAPVPAWSYDERAAITLDDLLTMRDGLDFIEDYIHERDSDTIEMLFGSGRDDVAAYATDRHLVCAPGTRFNYSSGTTNVLSSIVAGVVGRGPAYEAFLHECLFGPLGMASARPGFDAAGTWVASSFLLASARDFARFGELYLHGGEDLLPEGWVEHGTRPRSVDEETGSSYGAHWWLPPGDDGVFEARGYEGQSITVAPAKDLVVVRLGQTPQALAPALREWRAAVVEAVD